MEDLSDTGWGDAPCDALAEMSLSQATEPATENHTFHPFLRLPTEIRCQIWHNTWAPDTIDLWASGKPENHDWHGGQIHPLPASAHVHQESRSETLRKYRVIPNTPTYEFRARVNFELDTLSVDRYTVRATEFSEQGIYQKFERMEIRMFLMHKFHDWQHPTPTNVPNLWIAEGYFPDDRPSHETFDNFLRYVVKRYFSKVQEI
ncbi:hypothetical protein PG984_004915 [Apiospora sp. TS-2023a]